MKASGFAYVCPTSVQEALECLRVYGDDGKILAGGQSLLPILNLRLAHPSVLIDVGGIDELRTIRSLDDGIEIGALVSHRRIETGGESRLSGYEALCRTASLIGHRPIRTRGTIGGSLAHGDAAAEWCAVALVLDAEIVAAGPSGERRIPAGEFFRGHFTTSLRTDEILVGVKIPARPCAMAIHEHARRAGDFAMVISATNLTIEDGRLNDARIVLGGVAEVPVRMPDAESVLLGCELDSADVTAACEEAAWVAAQGIDPASDLHASGALRRRMAHALTRRALRDSVRALHATEGAG